MSLLYIVAGVNHFGYPEVYVKIMPCWARPADAMVLLSGVFEIILGLLLLFRKTRRLAAWSIILLLIAVFPANIQMMLNYRAAHHPLLWITMVRLPLQLVLIWWAYGFTRKVVQLH